VTDKRGNHVPSEIFQHGDDHQQATMRKYQRRQDADEGRPNICIPNANDPQEYRDHWCEGRSGQENDTQPHHTPTRYHSWHSSKSAIHPVFNSDNTQKTKCLYTNKDHDTYQTRRKSSD
jgi:hypothetical protein